MGQYFVKLFAPLRRTQRDDRGRACRSLFSFLARTNQRAQLLRSKSPYWKRISLVGYVTSFLLGSVVLVWVYALEQTRPGFAFPLPFGVLILLGFGLLMLAPWHVAFMIWGDRGASTLREPALRRGICPVCAESLLERPPESDGCRVCKSCKAAWRLPAARAWRTLCVCDYDCAGVQPDAYGFLCCPECGERWRALPVGDENKERS